MYSNSLFSHLRELSEGTDVEFSLTTPGLQSFVQQQQQQKQQQEDELDNAFNNFFVYHNQPAMDLFSMSYVSPFLSEYPMPSLTLDIAALAEQEHSFISPLYIYPTSSQVDELTALTDGQHIDSVPFADWSRFVEPVSESVPPMVLDFRLHKECAAPKGDLSPAAPSTPKASQSDSRLPIISSVSDTSSTTKPETKKLSESTGNRNRRAKRKAKTGELYATGTMKRLSQPKPYDKMVKKYRLKL